MLFSRNPKSGEIEAYTDECTFVGNVVTMGDLVGEQSAQDGGPGSGNWGHRGRPGLVGGSGPGGGTQYRGGRSDIGYFSSRKDWLNGLSGERQAEAAKVLRESKDMMKQKLRAKEIIDSLYDAGALSKEDRDKRLKEANIEQLREDMTPEEYIMKCGNNTEKNNLLLLAGEARGWPDTRKRLQSENLTDEEQKIMDWIYDNVADFYMVDPSVQEAYLALKAKALGLPDTGKPIDDEVFYLAGLKERPSEEVKKKGTANIDWFKPHLERGFSEGRMMEHFMQQITYPIDGKRPADPTKEEFYEMARTFADVLRHGDLKASSIDVARYTLNEMEKATGRWNYEDLSSLTDEDRKVIQECADTFLGPSKRQEEIDGSYLEELMKEISWSPLRKKAERRLAQEFLLIRLRLMTGIEPRPKDESEAYKKIEALKSKHNEERKEVKKLKAEREKREAQLRQEEEERRKKGIESGDPMISYERDQDKLGRDHLTDVINGVNPHYMESKSKRDKRYYWNCQRCVMAFVARMRGYKVEAKPKPVEDTRNSYDPIFRNGGLAAVFTGAKEEHVDGGTGDEQKKKIESDVTSWGDGAIGLVSVAWSRRSSAHIFVVMNDHGVIKWIDPQNPSADASQYVKTGNVKCYYTKMMRVDDKPFTSKIHEAVRPEGGQYGDHFFV